MSPKPHYLSNQTKTKQYLTLAYQMSMSKMVAILDLLSKQVYLSNQTSKHAYLPEFPIVANWLLTVYHYND